MEGTWGWWLLSGCEYLYLNIFLQEPQYSRDVLKNPLSEAVKSTSPYAHSKHREEYNVPLTF
jgi:hypothetical protein